MAVQALTKENFESTITDNDIVISTAGSTRPELVLRDVKGYREFHETLRERNR